jgi:hypothetical protein
MFAMGALSGIRVAPAVVVLGWLVAALAGVTLLDYARRMRAARTVSPA